MAGQTKVLTFAEGVSVSAPTQSFLQTTSFVLFSGDAAYVTAKGEPEAEGDSYGNTTDNHIHYFDGTIWRVVDHNKNSFSETTNPGLTDDVNAEYSIGSLWVNVTADKAFIALDVTAGAAIWQEIGAGGGGALNFYELGDAEDNQDTTNFSVGNNSLAGGKGTLSGAFTLSTTAADLIRGDKAFKLTLDGTPGNSDNDWVMSLPFDIPQGYRGRSQTRKFQYKYDGASDDSRAFVYSLEATKTITNITQANPAVVSIASHGYSNGDLVYLKDVVGMTEVNNFVFTVANVTAGTFELSGINSTGFTAYTSSGTGQKTVEQTTGSELLDQFTNPDNTAQTFADTVFVPTNATQLMVGFQVLTHATGSEELVWDDDIFSPDIINGMSLSNDTDWESYTPTFSAGWGIPTNVNFFHRIDGGDLIIHGSFTSGTVAASLGSISIPIEFLIDNTKISPSNLGFVGSLDRIRGGLGHTGNRASLFVDGTDTSLIFMSFTGLSATSYNKTNVNGFIFSGDSAALNIRIPIQGISAVADSIIAFNERSQNSMIRVRTANGFGSTNIKIRRFTTIEETFGNAITYADSATLGALFTINEDGVYTITLNDIGVATATVGISKNSSELTTNIISLINDQDILAIGQSGDTVDSISWSGILSKGDLIRPHSNASGGGTNDHASMTVTKIGASQLLGVPKPIIVYIKDEKSSGTAGGTFTSGAFQTRDLNTLSGDTSIVTLASNQFTLGPGTYDIESSAPAAVTSEHKIKLRNITDSTDALIGTSAKNNVSTLMSTDATLSGRIVLTATKIFELQHRANTTRVTNGFGDDAGFGVVEVYTQVKITKVA